MSGSNRPSSRPLIQVACMAKDGFVEIFKNFEPNIAGLDHLEDFVRAHITDPKIFKIEISRFDEQ